MLFNSLTVVTDQGALGHQNFFDEPSRRLHIDGRRFIMDVGLCYSGMVLQIHPMCAFHLQRKIITVYTFILFRRRPGDPNSLGRHGSTL